MSLLQEDKYILKMLVKPEIMNRIKDNFHLNIYETKVWVALLSKGIASAGDIAKISRVPRSRAYDVLESLEKKGFAREKLGKPIMYIGIKPKGILERLNNNVREKCRGKDKFSFSQISRRLRNLGQGGVVSCFLVGRQYFVCWHGSRDADRQQAQDRRRSQRRQPWRQFKGQFSH